MTRHPPARAQRSTPSWRRIAMLGATAALTMLAAACGAAPIVETVAVGADGVSIESPDGTFSLEVPAGALTANTSITVEALPPARWPAELADLPVLGDVYELGPSGLTFAEPVTVTRRFSASAENLQPELGTPVIFLASGTADGSWTALETLTVTVAGDEVVVTGQMEHFSSHAAFDGGVNAFLEPHAPVVRVGDTFTAEAAVYNRLFDAISMDYMVPYVHARRGFLSEESDVLRLAGYDHWELRSRVAADTRATFEARYLCYAPGEDLFGIDLRLTYPARAAMLVPGTSQPPLIAEGEDRLAAAARLWFGQRPEPAIQYDIAVLQGTATCTLEAPPPPLPDPGVDLPLGIHVDTASERVEMPVLDSFEQLWAIEYPQAPSGYVIVFRLDGIDYEANMMTEDGGHLSVMRAHPPYCEYTHVHADLPNRPIRSLLPGPDGEHLERQEHLGECGFGPPNFYIIRDPR